MTTIWAGIIGITLCCSIELSKKIEEFYKDFTDSHEGQIYITFQTVNHHSIPDVEQLYTIADHILFRVANGYLTGAIEKNTLRGVAFIDSELLESDELLKSIDCMMSRIIAEVSSYFGYILLHSSSLLINNEVICIVGNSEAGKTTMVHFAEKDMNALSDDITLISPGTDRTMVTVIPFGWQTKISARGTYPVNAIILLERTLGASTEALDINKQIQAISEHQLFRAEIRSDSRITIVSELVLRIARQTIGYKIKFMPIKFYNGYDDYTKTIYHLLRSISIGIDKKIQNKNSHDIIAKENVNVCLDRYSGKIYKIIKDDAKSEKYVVDLEHIISNDVKCIEKKDIQITSTLLGFVTNSPRGNTIEVILDKRYVTIIMSPKEDMPITGDYVLLTKNGGYQIDKILKRKNALYRIKDGNKQYMAANIDVVFIVTSADHDFSIARLERYCILANKIAARICFVLTKTDINSHYREFYQILTERFGSLNYDVVEINYTKDMKVLYDYWHEGETAILLGSSGVGKSTIINTLKGKTIARTQPVRQYDYKGRHTTTERRAYILSESRVLIDTPGLRAVGVGKSVSSVNAIFPKIDALSRQCRFSNCTHTSEPGCMIQSALKSGELNIDDYMRYLKLMQKQKELDIIKNGKVYEKEILLKEAKKESKHHKGGQNA